MVRRYVRMRTFSTVDRVLIHLSTDALRPDEETQEGIAAATRSGRSTLTKWLLRLERRGLVARDRIRLPGHPLPKYAYRLSESGWQAASALRERLGSDTVTVRTPSLGELSVRMSEVSSLTPGRLGLTALVAAIRRGRLDLARLAQTTARAGPTVWGTGLRRVDRFFGRTEELAALDTWWASRSRTLLITGLAGIGKSALVAAWVQGRPIRVPVYGFEIRRSSNAPGLLGDFAAFLAALEKPGLAGHLAQGLPLDLAFVSRLLRRDLHGTRILVALDNADQASRGLAQLVDRLFVRADERLDIRVIVLARRVPRWLGRSASTEGREVRNLGGLDPSASKSLLRARGLGPESALAQEIIRKTRGHPLLLSLWAAHGTGRGSAVRRYLKDEVWSSLSARDRAALEAASIFRKPVSGRILGVVAGTDSRVAESLVERNLLERTVAGGYSTHDLVREFVLGQMSELRGRRLHARAADALVRSSLSRERWEGVYHLLEAGNVRDAASLLDAEGGLLVDSVAAEDIASLVGGLRLDETDSGPYCAFAEVLADSLRIRGHLGPAAFQYGHARHLAESSGQEGRIPRLLRKMAFLERCRNHYAKALGYLVEARGRLLGTRDPAETIEVLREMALAEQSLGHLQEAQAHLSEAVDLATESSDRGALSRTVSALGTLQAQLGYPEQGLESNLEGLRIAERAGSLTEIAHGHIVVGAALTGMGRGMESLSHFAQGYEIARLLGNLRLVAYATMNKMNALLQVHRYDDARECLREAQGHFDILEEKDTQGFLKTYEGELAMATGHWSRATRAWEEGLEMLRAHGSPADLAMVLREVAGFYARHGELDSSEARLMEARAIAESVENGYLLSCIASDLQRLRALPERGDHP